jgi:hypothetical protein
MGVFYIQETSKPTQMTDEKQNLSSKAHIYLAEVAKLQKIRGEAIEELLAKRDEINAQLKEMGYEGKPRKPRDPNAPKNKGGRPKKNPS